MTVQEISQSVGVATVAIGALRWLIGIYFKKSTELENLKSNHRSLAEKTISDEIANLKGAVVVFRQELNDLKLKLTDYSALLRENGRVMEIAQKQWEKTAERLEDRYSSLDGAEVVKVGENTFIFKGRRTR